VVCRWEAVPANGTLDCEAPWRILKIDGVLDFGLVGILVA
jgi:hypothetical protein